MLRVSTVIDTFCESVEIEVFGVTAAPDFSLVVEAIRPSLHFRDEC